MALKVLSGLENVHITHVQSRALQILAILLLHDRQNIAR
jgi:hypothetical protein